MALRMKIIQCSGLEGSEQLTHVSLSRLYQLVLSELFHCARNGEKKKKTQPSCSSTLDSLEGDRVLAVVRLAVPHQEAGLSAGLQLELSLLPAHAAMVPAEARERKTVTDYSKWPTMFVGLCITTQNVASTVKPQEQMHCSPCIGARSFYSQV